MQKSAPSDKKINQLCMNVFHRFPKARGNKTDVFYTDIAWLNDSFYSAGILGFGLYLLLGITSLPSVSNALSWREFSFIQVGLCERMLVSRCLRAWPNCPNESSWRETESRGQPPVCRVLCIPSKFHAVYPACPNWASVNIYAVVVRMIGTLGILGFRCFCWIDH